MLRRDQPHNDRTELSELLRRLGKPGGSVTVSLDGRPIARVEPRRAAPAKDAPADGEPPAGDAPA